MSGPATVTPGRDVTAGAMEGGLASPDRVSSKPVARRTRFSRSLVVGVVGVVALAGAVFYVGGVDPVSWLGLGSGGEWTFLRMELVPEFGGERVRFTINVTGYGADEKPIPADRLRNVGAWIFAEEGILVASVSDVSRWETCDPLTCEFTAQLGSVVYFDPVGKAGPGSFAFDTGEKRLYNFLPVSGWNEIENWQSYFKTFVVGRVPASEFQKAFSVIVYVSSSVDSERLLQLTLLRGETRLESASYTVPAGFDGFRMVAMSARVPQGEVTLQVQDAASEELATRVLRPEECGSREVRVEVEVSTGAAPRIVGAECT